MKNKGSALAFLFVLFVMCIGSYAAVSALLKGKASSPIALETEAPTTQGEMTLASSTPVPTDTPAETPVPHSELSTPVAPTATPVPPATPTSPPRPTATPSSTATPGTASPTRAAPIGEYPFVATRNERDCRANAGYIRGTVYDADGNTLSGVNVHLYSDAYDQRIQSKGGIDMGKYDFPMGPDAARFYLEIVDNLGNPISAAELVDYDPACTNYVDWQRVQ